MAPPEGVRWRRTWKYPLVMGVPPGVPRLATLEAALDAVDCFHATAYAVPRVRRAPVVLTVHDLTLLRHPELGTPALRRTVGAVARRATEARLVIADSHATADDLSALCGVPAARIRVVPLGVAPAFQSLARDAARAHVARRFGLDASYLLHVGTLEPRKNLPRLIAACATLWRGGALAQRLVLAGADGWGAAAVAAAMAQPATEQVVRLGRVDAADRRRFTRPPTRCLPPTRASACRCSKDGAHAGAGRARRCAAGDRRRRCPADRSARRRGARRRCTPHATDADLRARLPPPARPAPPPHRLLRARDGGGLRERWRSSWWCRGARGHGVTVKLIPPVPATFDQGLQPASLPPTQVAPAGQARMMPL